MSEAEVLRATEFALAGIKLAIERVDSRIERLEAAFLKEHPLAVLPDIPYTPAEEQFFAEYADLIES